MINQKIRYLPVIKFIVDNKPTSICEVGSNNYGIGKFLDINFIGVDISFGNSNSKNPKMEQIVGSIYNLPLDTSSIDLVFSLDTLEHLDVSKREQALNEMLRVSKKYVIIGFPFGKYAKEIDNKINKIYFYFNRKRPVWLIEHLENKCPEELFLDKILENLNHKFYSIKNENAKIHLILILIESLPLIKNILNYFSKLQNPFLQKIYSSLSFGKCYRKIYFIEK